ncbi:SCO2524 family protein [Amycolatopsis pigmentata]|uniref:SCO2524 family protein n=1 Tax=Amycolatopsis pigmentata TaxID=450801 RepID=A0ABW5FSN4_9PSEU
MRLQPRQQLLDVWRALTATAYSGREWEWCGREDPNSVSDAEQLLCLLYPATELTSLALDRPDAMASDVHNALRDFGDPVRIPQVVVDVIADYIARYTDEDGEPEFGGGSYLRTHSAARAPDGAAQLSAEQRRLGVVDSYSLSVTLCLGALGFLGVFGQSVRRPDLKAKVKDLQGAVGKRLTSAMIGLLRSFTVQVVEPDSEVGAVMLSTVNQTGAPEHVVLDELRTRLVRLRARLRDDVRIGIDRETVDLDNDNLLFECGWTWGVARSAKPVDINLAEAGLTVRPRICDQDGVADARPYLYSTVVALDGINDLLSARTGELGLLNDAQVRLAEALRVRWTLTQRYWSAIARFGDQQWPLEDIPWRTSDGQESDYFSLLVSAVLVQDLQDRQATDDDLNRAVSVFESLAQRGRITRRVMESDRSVGMHVPGVQMRLGGTDTIGPQLYWSVADFAPLLLKRTLQAARLSANVTARNRLLRLAETTMEHLARRQISRGPAAGLWDDPAEVLFPYEERKPEEAPSWYLTERVVEALVAAARLFAEQPLRSAALIIRTHDLLNEAEHLLNQELLGADATTAVRNKLGEIEAKLIRARAMVSERPGTAHSLTVDALLKLDQIAIGHDDAARSF